MNNALFTIFAVVNEATGGSTPPISKIKYYEYLENSSKLHLYFYGIFLTCSLSPCDLTVCTYVIQSITAILVSVDAACQVNQDGILTNTTKTADVLCVNGVIEGCMFDLMVIVWSGDKRTDIHWTLTK